MTSDLKELRLTARQFYVCVVGGEEYRVNTYQAQNSNNVVGVRVDSPAFCFVADCYENLFEEIDGAIMEYRELSK